MSEKVSFMKNHGDTIAIIASTIGVNVALAAVIISMWISNTHRVDACNSRIDQTLARIDGMYEILMKRN